MDGDGYGDGANEFAGGGFMPAPSTPQQGIAGGGSGFSPSAGARRSNISLQVPFTVKHLHKCYAATGGDTLSVNGQEINNVVLVGKVLGMESRTTDLQFLLDDGTGKVEIRKWHDDQEHERELLATIQTGTIVKVLGVPRKMGNKYTLSANSIRPITDFNEYTCHFLDCIFAYQYSRAQGGGTGSPAQAQGQAAGSQQQGRGMHQQPSQAQSGRAGGGAPGGQGFVPADTNLPLHERVLRFFSDNESSDPAGLHRDTVARNINGASPQQVIEAIEFLVSEGHLYSTIDDLHFKTLGS